MKKNSGVLAIFKSIFYIILNTLIIMGLVSISVTILHLNGINFDKFFAENEFFMDAIFSLVLVIIYLGILIFKQIRSREKYNRDFVYTRGFGFKNLLRGLSIIFASAGFTVLWFSLVDKLADHVPMIEDSLNNFEAAFSGVELGEERYRWILLSIVIIGPLLEELLLRGIVFGNMKDSMPISLAILLNGIIFGIFHMNIVQGVYASIAGILLASVYYYSKSIGLVIILHMVNNFLSTLPPIVYEKIGNIDSILNVVFLVSIPIGIISLMRMRRESLKESNINMEFTKLI